MLDAAREQRPDLAILDVGLPDINGFELCRRLLAEYPQLPLLFLTARSEEIDRLIGLEMGADDYIARPFSPREVCARVRTVLRRLQKQRLSNSVGTQRIGLFELVGLTFMSFFLLETLTGLRGIRCNICWWDCHW